MLRSERKAAFSLALVYALRMLGLFMILPVFSLYADQYQHSTPVLVGTAIGVYGLTQGLFQIPFGFLSDRFGRKPVIVAGLLIFALGSIIAAEAESIYAVIAGRALQGFGAIAAAVMALAADLTRPEVRLRVMALIGMSIGASFMISVVAGPVLAAAFGLRLLFWAICGLALLSVLVVVFIVPDPEQERFYPEISVAWQDASKILVEGELLRLGFGVFVLHLVLSATFVIFPLVLHQEMNIQINDHWKTYLPVFALSVLCLAPMVIVAERLRRVRAMFVFSVALLVLAEFGLAWGESYGVVLIMLVMFFGAFNYLEAAMPSMVSQIATLNHKGTAMGLFSSAQFLGAFSGGVLGGLLLANFDHRESFAVLCLVLCVWLVVALKMKYPDKQYIRYPEEKPQ